MKYRKRKDGVYIAGEGGKFDFRLWLKCFSYN
jgi:hypothetical protein